MDMGGKIRRGLLAAPFLLAVVWRCEGWILSPRWGLVIFCLKPTTCAVGFILAPLPRLGSIFLFILLVCLEIVL
jgi:hypothetical protein